ncbi:MAG: protein kinase [Actinomycetota bacterium]
MDLGIEGLEWREVVGHGGFGTVHLAHDVDHGRDVAVKVLGPLADEDEERRFDRERRLMGQLSAHPNIVTIHTSGVSALGVPYLVMEYVTGGSLADRFEAGALDPAEVVEIGIALADALGDAHEAGILHRDIKPPNILMGRGDTPMLTDFGIASAASDLSMRDTISATPAYAPPEVLNGREVDERGDVYSLAATLHACLTGDGPYSASGQPVLTVLNRIANDPVPMVDRDDVPAGLTTLLHRCLSKDPDERPIDMAAFRSELAAVDLDEPPHVAAPPGPDGDPLATNAVGGGAAAGTDPLATNAVAGAAPPPTNAGDQPVGSPTPAAADDDGGRRRGLALAGATAAVVAVIVGVILLAGGGSDSDDVEAAGASTEDTALTTTPETDPTDTVVAASDTTTTTETESTTTTTTTPVTTTTEADSDSIASGGGGGSGVVSPPPTSPPPSSPPPTSPPPTSPPPTSPPPTSPPPTSPPPTQPPVIAPTAGFTSTQTLRAGEGGSFSNTTTGTAPISFVWDWGNGATSTSADTTYAWPTPGTYTVRLTATNAAGSDVATASVTVLPGLPRATIGGGSTLQVNEQFFWPVESSNAVSGTWSSNCGVANPGWSPGNGWGGSYATPADCTLSLTVFNEAGESFTTSKSFTVVG